MGKVQQQFFPDSSRPEILVDLWFPEGTSYRRQRSGDQARRGAPDEARGRRPRHAPGSAAACRASYLPLDQIFPQTNASARSIVLPKDLKARETLRMRLPALLADRSSPRCAAASSCCPTGRRCRIRCSSASSGRTRPRCARYADEVKAIMRAEPEHARRQRQLERVGQGAAAGRRPGQGARARRLQPGDRAGCAHDQQRHDDRPVPRRRPAHRHRAAPAARTSATRSPTSANAYVPTTTRPQHPAGADRRRRASSGSRACCGARAATTPATVQGDIVEGLQGATVTAQLDPLFAADRASACCRGYRIEVAGAVEESSKGPGLDRGRRAADAVHHVHAADAAAARASAARCWCS